MILTKKDTLYYYYSNPKKIYKIAAFDLDYTLIKTASGNVFPKDENDWDWLYENVPEKLKQLVDDEYSIVIFTNQKGISQGKQTIQNFSIKVENIIKSLNLSIDILIATDDDWYRKPMTGMWEFYLTSHKIGSIEDSFYCGDAAGRTYVNKKLNDHSDADINFANNINLTFKMPEEVFDQKLNKQYVIKSSYDNLKLIDLISEKQKTMEIKGNEMVILIGPPASGKSTFSELHYPTYVRINRDIEKTDAKCLKKTEDALKKNKSVIIDNTNPSAKARQNYIELANKYNYSIKIYSFDIEKPVIEHLNYYRTQLSKGSMKLIPEIAYRMYFSKYEEPSESEFNNNNYEIIKYKPKIFEDILYNEFYFKY
jgi:bifunctional polynucleotide phosphatase/kinase